MSWAILVGSGVLECVWAAALDKSAGFSRPVPTIVFFVAMALSMLGLSHAVRDIPLGVAYSVWVGIEATLTFAYSAIIDGKGTTPLHLLCLRAGCLRDWAQAHLRVGRLTPLSAGIGAWEARGMSDVPTITEIAYRTWHINECGINSMYLLGGTCRLRLLTRATAS